MQPSTADRDLLLTLPLFQHLTEEELARVAGMLRRQVTPAGTTVFSLDQPAEVVYVVAAGTLKIHIEQRDGTDVILDFSGPGDVLGEMAVLQEVGRSASVVTIEESVLLWMSGIDFRECLRTMPAMSENLLRILSQRLRLANERIQAFASLDVYGRVARHILAYAEKYGQRTPEGGLLLPIRLTQSDLADLVGASRERVNQVIASYKRQNFLSVDRNHRITVHDPQALAARFQ